MSDPLLADLLYESSMKNFGSDEHMQIAGLIKDSSKNIIDKEAALEIRNFLNNDPISFERCLDIIERPNKPIWYEWGLETRAGHGGNEHVKTGCLVTPHPFDESLMLAVTGWSTNGMDARHAFAVALFDTDTMAKAAAFARGQKASKATATASLTRIMSYIEVTMPPGFDDEIEILTDGDPFAKERSYRDATAEIPFLWALMLLERTNGGLCETVSEGITHKKLASAPSKGVLRDLLDKVRGRTSYLSVPRSHRASPTWYR